MIDLETQPFSLVRCNLYPNFDMAESVSREAFKNGAEHGKIYTVDGIEASSSYSSIYLMEIPGVRFNTLVFENIEDTL